jgi:acetylornithine/succinyldiaminopimelate/putrescine aminotransferase
VLAAHHDPEARPDGVVLAKGLGASYAPLGAFLALAAFVDQLAETTGVVVPQVAVWKIAMTAGMAHVLLEVDATTGAATVIGRG